MDIQNHNTYMYNLGKYTKQKYQNLIKTLCVIINVLKIQKWKKWVDNMTNYKIQIMGKYTGQICSFFHKLTPRKRNK